MTKSAVTALGIADLKKLATEFGIDNATTGTKKTLIPLVMERMETLPSVEKEVPNTLNVVLNHKLVSSFNATGKDSTTIARFFNKFGAFADSTKDSLIIEFNNQKIDFFKVRKKLNKLVSTAFIEHSAHSFYNPETHQFENLNDEGIRETIKFIREAMPMSYSTINNLLTMNAKDFNDNLQKDEIFNDYVKNAQKSEVTAKLLSWA